MQELSNIPYNKGTRLIRDNKLYVVSCCINGPWLHGSDWTHKENWILILIYLGDIPREIVQ